MGAQLRVYRSKIRSAQTTKKITRAMELISASRIFKAQARCAAFGPYSSALTRAVSTVIGYSDIEHPLITPVPEPKRSAVVVFASDRGLAGAFNAQVLREASELDEALTERGVQSEFYLVGRKAVGFFDFRRRPYVKSWIGESENPSFELAQEISATILEAFGREENPVDEVHLVYNRFVSMISQVPEAVRLLPMEVVDAEEGSAPEILPLYSFEPSADAVLDELLQVYVESRIFNTMLQSAAAKHAATQRAMKSASDNADKLINEYTRLANNARQAEITQQISEIIGGADALS